MSKPGTEEKYFLYYCDWVGVFYIISNVKIVSEKIGALYVMKFAFPEDKSFLGKATIGLTWKALFILGLCL